MTRTIHRAARRHRFVIVDQAAIEDTRLSWAARGLLAYLLSRPDDWKVLINDREPALVTNLLLRHCNPTT